MVFTFARHWWCTWNFAVPPVKFYDKLTHWGRDKMPDTLQMIFSNAFSSVKKLGLWLKFHWSLFPGIQLTISHHWFRWWLGPDQGTSGYLNQWWLSSLMHICITWPQWVNTFNITWFITMIYIMDVLSNDITIVSHLSYHKNISCLFNRSV